MLAMTLRIDLETLVQKRLIPKGALDIILCHLVKRKFLSAHTYSLRYHFRVCALTKSFKKEIRIIVISPRDSALSRLKSLYAKKPKNPV